MKAVRFLAGMSALAMSVGGLTACMGQKDVFDQPVALLGAAVEAGLPCAAPASDEHDGATRYLCEEGILLSHIPAGDPDELWSRYRAGLVDVVGPELDEELIADTSEVFPVVIGDGFIVTFQSSSGGHAEKMAEHGGTLKYFTYADIADSETPWSRLESRR